MALSPMMQHYLKTKEENPDCILFYRLGDFYEMFFEDAMTVSKELELTLTGKSCGLEERAPMCGVPFHAADTYISKLIDKGYKVAICEQVEDPKTAKGMVKREVVRIVTPGTVLNSEDLDESKNNYLMSIAYVSDKFGIAISDISTGQCLVSQLSDRKKLLDEIRKFSPAELICNQSFLVSGIDIVTLKEDRMLTSLGNNYFTKDSSDDILNRHFHNQLDDTVMSFECGLIALGALFRYLYETQKSDIPQITRLTPYFCEAFMLIDNATARNLELTETLREKQKKGSLLWVLDKTKTAMGARLLRNYVERPLLQHHLIEDRLSFVSLLCEEPIERDELREYLQPIYDMERLASRITSKHANPRDLISFRNSLEMLPHILIVLQALAANNDQLCILNTILEQFDPLEDLFELIQNSIVEDPPITLRDGGIIKDGYHELVDQYKEAGKHGKQWLSELEEREREQTGIKTLRIKFNKVFGYCIEVTNSFKDQVPAHYIRRQTLTGAERYITDELKKMEETILGAEDRLTGLEYELFCQIRDQIGEQIARIQSTANALAMLDVFASLSFVADRNQFIRPEITTDGIINIKDGRHPVVEQMLSDQMFIPNDILLDRKENRVSIITGPNMAGKSTYMRQAALIVLMAQIGSFVPAKSANIGIVDRIFTRVGASDDLASGKSTFMIEMNEVANILKNATAKSLLILDEIGRGTSTFDGLSIAWAVVEYVANEKKIGAKALFATHYHELTELEGKIQGVKNHCIAVKENGDDIVFLRKIIRGGADRSYGIQVARLAGVPDEVLERAKELAEQLAKSDIAVRIRMIDEAEGKQISIFDWKKPQDPGRPQKTDKTAAQGSQDTESASDSVRFQPVIEALNSADILHLTPIEAMNELYRLHEEVNRLYQEKEK